MAITGKATESGASAFISNVTPTVLLTCAAGAGLIDRLQKLIVANPSGVDTTLKLYKVPSGGSISGDDYVILPPQTIAAGTSIDVRKVAGMILENGDSLRALAGSASHLRYDLGYFEES